eukprot:SAG31_NODE_1509_length_8062_cov_6.974884_9_plen_213_part_00
MTRRAAVPVGRRRTALTCVKLRRRRSWCSIILDRGELCRPVCPPTRTRSSSRVRPAPSGVGGMETPGTLQTSIPVDNTTARAAGENPGIKLLDTDEETVLTAASFWRTILSPMGPGCVLFIQSKDFTGDEWSIWSDNIAMARWFQKTQLTPSTPKDLTTPVVSATFESSGDPNYFWTETCTSSTGDIIEMTWTDIGGACAVRPVPNAGHLSN